MEWLNAVSERARGQSVYHRVKLFLKKASSPHAARVVNSVPHSPSAPWNVAWQSLQRFKTPVCDPTYERQKYELWLLAFKKNSWCDSSNLTMVQAWVSKMLEFMCRRYCMFLSFLEISTSGFVMIIPPLTWVHFSPGSCFADKLSVQDFRSSEAEKANHSHLSHLGDKEVSPSSSANRQVYWRRSFHRERPGSKYVLTLNCRFWWKILDFTHKRDSNVKTSEPSTSSALIC